MRVYCLGDSMTYGFGGSRREAWPALVGAATGHEMINGGVNGDATSGMLARFCVDVPRIKPNVAILMGGCNDIFLAGSDSTARCNMGSLVQQALSLAIIPVIGFPVPFEPSLVLVSSDGFPLGSRDPAPVCRMAAPLYRSFSGALRGFLGVVRANARFSENFILPRRPPPDRPGT